MAEGLTKHKNGAITVEFGSTKIDLKCPTVDELLSLMTAHDAALEQHPAGSGEPRWRAEWFSLVVKTLAAVEGFEAGQWPGWIIGPVTPRTMIDHWLYGPLAPSGV